MDYHVLFSRFPTNFPLPMVLDGATGTALMRRGMPQGCCTEAWVLEHPAVLQEVQQNYRAEGSDAVYTPTFGCNVSTLQRHNLQDHVEEYNRTLAQLSRSVGSGLIGGDLSPTGKIPAPAGDATWEELTAIYRQQAMALEPLVDFFAVETMISLAEARAAVYAIRSFSRKPIFVTLTVDERGRTMSGDTLEASLLTLSTLDIQAFGCNCSTGPEPMLRLLRPLAPLASALGIPLIAKPNAGMPKLQSDGSNQFDMTPEDFSSFAPQFLEAGILILGGCCGTDERHIRALRNAVDSWNQPLSFPAEDPASLYCNQRTVVRADEGMQPLPADEDLFDSEEPLLTVRLNHQEDADFLLENAYMLPAPIRPVGEEDAVRYFLQRYTGKASNQKLFSI